MSALVLLLVGMTAAAIFVARPLLGPRAAWPQDPPPWRDDLLRAASSLRDLDFAHAAGVLPTADHVRLRARVEREAIGGVAPRVAGVAPVATLGIAALLAAVAAVAIGLSLPTTVGDRAPGGLITGDGGARISPTTEELEARARARPADIPSKLALADAYLQEERLGEAVVVYRAVLDLDRESVPALNALGVILFRSGELDGAEAAVDRVLSLRPRDSDSLLLKGFIRYRRGDNEGAIGLWERYLAINERDAAAAGVRALIADARKQAR